MHKNERMYKAQLKRFFEKTTIETKYGPKDYFMSYKEEEDYLRQQCRVNDIRSNIQWTMVKQTIEHDIDR